MPTNADKQQTNRKAAHLKRQKTNQKTKVFRLPNGLRVLFYPSRKSPVVSVQMWVKTGSADERAGEEGISHFIEHLVFKGSEKYGVGEIASVVEGSGGELNAYTSFDQTVFYVTISKQFLDVALDTVSQMMGFPKFDSDEIDKEREVVIEEIKRSTDSLSREASRLLFSTMYEKHPYGIPVIGYEKNIQEVSRKTLVDYYHSRYVPTNMTLVVVGDFEEQSTKDKVNKMFSLFEKNKLRDVQRANEPSKNQTKIAVRKSRFEESVVNIAWPAVGVKHADVAALDVLSMILGQGEGSRLNQVLRVQKPLVNYVSSYTYTPMDPGFLSVSMGLNSSNLEAALEALGEELALIRNEAPSQEEFDRALANFEAEQYYSMETVDGLSSKIGSYNFYFNDPDYHEIYMRQVRKLKPEDLTRIAQKYIRTDMVQITFLSKDGSAKEEKILTDWSDRLTLLEKQPPILKNKAKAEAKGKPTAPKKISSATKNDGVPERVTLPSGARVLLRVNHDVPVVSLRSAFLGGMRLESLDKGGLTDLMSNVWLGGTKTKSEEDIFLTSEGLAARVRAYGGRNTAGINADFLSGTTDQAIDLFADIMANPTFPKAIIEREKVVMLEQIKSKSDNPSSICMENLSSLLFGAHTYGRPYEGTEKSVAALTAEEALEHYNAMVTSNNLVFSISGAFDRAEILERLDEVSESLNARETQLPKTALPALSKSAHKFVEAQREQSHLAIGYRGISLSDPRRFAQQIMHAVLSGQGGRLFLNLRDKASLAYSVAPIHLEGMEGGFFGGYIGCSPEKVEKALEMLKIEFRKISTQLISADEMQRAKRYLIGRHDIGIQRNSAIAGAMLFDDVYGLPFDETFRYAERINAVTAKEVKDLAASIFEGPSVTSLIGPRDFSNP